MMRFFKEQEDEGLHEIILQQWIGVFFGLNQHHTHVKRRGALEKIDKDSG